MGPQKGPSSAAPAPESRPAPSPVALHHVRGSALRQMQPGDLLLLSETDYLRARLAPVFAAVLACPLCCSLSLITLPQYHGLVPVVCPADFCSCQFRIKGESDLVYLAAH